MNKGVLAILLVIVIILAAVSILFVARLRTNESNSSQTSTATGYYFQFQELNQSNTMSAGTTALLIFNVTSPVNGTIYYGVVSAPVPPPHQNFSMQNMTSQDFQLPSGVQVNYPNGNMITTQGTAVIQVTLSPTITAGQVSLVFEIMQQYGPSNVNGQGHGFALTVLSA